MEAFELEAAPQVGSSRAPEPEREMGEGLELEAGALERESGCLGAACEGPGLEMGALERESDEGNVEYKLKLTEVSRARFTQLVTQMKYRLEEGGGEALYEIGVADDGRAIGLSPDELATSLATLRRMCEALRVRMTVLRTRPTGCGDVAEVRVQAEVAVPDATESAEVRVAVLGDHLAGKSTLVGVLSHGVLDNGAGAARAGVLRHVHELESGSTHKYYATTVSGFTRFSPDYATLVLAADGHLEPLHEALARALLAPSFYVINKADRGADAVARVCAQLAGALRETRPRARLLRVRGAAEAVVAARALGESATPRGGNALRRLSAAGAAARASATNGAGALAATAIASAPASAPASTAAADPDADEADEEACVVPVLAVSSVTGEGLEALRAFLRALPPRAHWRARAEEPAVFSIHHVFAAAGGGGLRGRAAAARRRGGAQGGGEATSAPSALSAPVQRPSLARAHTHGPNGECAEQRGGRGGGFGAGGGAERRCSGGGWGARPVSTSAAGAGGNGRAAHANGDSEQSNGHSNGNSNGQSNGQRSSSCRDGGESSGRPPPRLPGSLSPRQISQPPQQVPKPPKPQKRRPKQRRALHESLCLTSGSEGEEEGFFGNGGSALAVTLSQFGSSGDGGGSSGGGGSGGCGGGGCSGSGSSGNLHTLRNDNLQAHCAHPSSSSARAHADEQLAADLALLGIPSLLGSPPLQPARQQTQEQQQQQPPQQQQQQQQQPQQQQQQQQQQQPPQQSPQQQQQQHQQQHLAPARRLNARTSACASCDVTLGASAQTRGAIVTGTLMRGRLALSGVGELRRAPLPAAEASSDGLGRRTGTGSPGGEDGCAGGLLTAAGAAGKLLIGPDSSGRFWPVSVCGLQAKSVSVASVSAGQSASLHLEPPTHFQPRRGMVLVAAAHRPRACRQFDAVCAAAPPVAKTAAMAPAASGGGGSERRVGHPHRVARSSRQLTPPLPYDAPPRPFLTSLPALPSCMAARVPSAWSCSRSPAPSQWARSSCCTASRSRGRSCCAPSLRASCARGRRWSSRWSLSTRRSTCSRGQPSCAGRHRAAGAARGGSQPRGGRRRTRRAAGREPWQSGSQSRSTRCPAKNTSSRRNANGAQWHDRL
ncbi:hypothetical protein T492DRAFT_1145053 [Pavlovales sp. CCMP2436]|nr:hypothetical protein T492DRAFT_1145053 [Pavlovales sp. CCMP2436]